MSDLVQSLWLSRRESNPSRSFFTDVAGVALGKHLPIYPARMSPIDPQILERINADSQPSRRSIAFLRTIDICLSGNQRRALFFVAVVAVGVSALLLISAQARPHADVISTQSPSASQAPTPLTSILVVDVQGAVVKPGLYELPLGARVGDAIKAAGGVRKGATTSSVNLARFVEDGEQVFLSGVMEGASGSGSNGEFPSATSPNGKLNLNRATVSELDGLPGVGPVLAKRIIEYRGSKGSFGSVEELQKVSGIGPAKFSELRNFVTV